MLPRERVLKALAFEEPDRTPIDCWITTEALRKLYRHFGTTDKEDVLRRLHVDLRMIPGPRYVGPELERHPDGAVEDIWGVPRIEKEFGQGDRRGSYKEVTRFPLAEARTVKDIEQYPKWPSADWFDFSDIAAQCRAVSEYAVIAGGDRLNRTAVLKPAMYLRGTEQIFIDMAEQPAVAEAIFERIAAFYLEFDRRLFEAADGGIDIFQMGDDFGMQHGLLCSYDMWKRYFAPHLRRFIELPHEFGLKVMHHTCGAVAEIIPDFIDMGLDILNPIQPRCVGMDPAELKRRFGRRICFHGSIDIQKTVPFGSVDDVRAEVRDRMAALAPGGGFIICTAHNIQADAPLENILALFDAYLEFGRYPIRT